MLEQNCDYEVLKGVQIVPFWNTKTEQAICNILKRSVSRNLIRMNEYEPFHYHQEHKQRGELKAVLTMYLRIVEDFEEE